MADSEENYRLPTGIRPLSYKVYFQSVIEDDTFYGSVVIVLEVFIKRKTIALHQRGLKIVSAQLITDDQAENYDIEISSIGDPSKYDIFEVTTKNDLNEGRYTLTLQFNGSLRPSCGFCSGTYELCYNTCEETNKTPKHKFKETDKYLINAKFEPMYANLRRTFPCFDEPDLKANFNITLVIPSSDGYNAVSNIPTREEIIDEPKRGLTTVTFEDIISTMSPYQVWFMISDFNSISKERTSKKGDLIKVYTKEAQREDNRYFALDIIDKAVDYYENIFPTIYVRNLNIIAIPDMLYSEKYQYATIFKEAEFLYDEKNNSIIHKREIVIAICRKIAYLYVQQFASFNWWNEIWFIEGLVTFFAYKCADNILSKRDCMQQQFLVDITQSVFVNDAELNAHPLAHNVTNPRKMSLFFDEISRKKAACLISMLENFLGYDNFHEYTKAFILNKEYRNYTRFFDNTSDEIGKFKDINAWIKQEGYPVIDVKKCEGNMYVLTQKRFLADSDAKCDITKSDYGYRWSVPITYITNSHEKPIFVYFDKDMTEVQIRVSEQTRWAKFNVDQVGYYRVNYGTEWRTFTDVLLSHPTTLSVSDRTNLLDDLFNLADADEVDYGVLLDHILYLYQEYSSLPWAVACPRLKKMCLLFSEVKNNTPYLLKTFISKLVLNIYKNLTWDVDDDVAEDAPETHVDENLRAMILEMACLMEVPGSTETAAELLNDRLLRNKTPHPNIREVVYRYGVCDFKEEEWMRMLVLYESEVDLVEKRKLLMGITSVKSTELLHNLIVKATGDQFSQRDCLECLILMSENPVGMPIVWHWMRNNWEYLIERFTINDEGLGELVSAITKYFATENKLYEMKAFFEKYPYAGAGAENRDKTLVTVSRNIKWIKTKGPAIYNWCTSGGMDSILRNSV